MSLLALLLLLPPDPCKTDTASWQAVRHGPEEIRYRQEGRFLYLALRNLGSRTTHADVIWREIGFSGTARVFDISAYKDEGKVHAGFARKLAPGACAAYRIEPPVPKR